MSVQYIFSIAGVFAVAHIYIHIHTYMWLHIIYVSVCCLCVYARLYIHVCYIQYIYIYICAYIYIHTYKVNLMFQKARKCSETNECVLLWISVCLWHFLERVLYWRQGLPTRSVDAACNHKVAILLDVTSWQDAHEIHKVHKTLLQYFICGRCQASTFPFCAS